ncbi:MAG: hypothetical protein QFE16_08480 [Pseudomonadota bacterium]|nr:hypothetical protein [Pseudomonadota bacterium]
MKKHLILAAAAAIALSSAGVAQARDLSWSVSIGDPLLGAVISNGPGYGYDRGYYVYAPRVYAPPPVVVVPPPRVVYEQPYVYAPVPWGYAAQGYVPYRHDHPDRDRWSRRYEEHARYGRDDDRRDFRDDDRGYRGDRGDRDDRDGQRDERRQRH